MMTFHSYLDHSPTCLFGSLTGQSFCSVQHTHTDATLTRELHAEAYLAQQTGHTDCFFALCTLLFVKQHILLSISIRAHISYMVAGGTRQWWYTKELQHCFLRSTPSPTAKQCTGLDATSAFPYYAQQSCAFMDPCLLAITQLIHK